MPLYRPDEYEHSNPNYPIADMNNVRGLQTTTNIAGRDAIDPNKRKLGGLVSVTGVKTVYQYTGPDLTNTAWTNIANWSTSSGGGTIIYVTDEAEFLAALGIYEYEVTVILLNDITITTGTPIHRNSRTNVEGYYNLILSGNANHIFLASSNPLKGETEQILNINCPVKITQDTGMGTAGSPARSSYLNFRYVYSDNGYDYNGNNSAGVGPIGIVRTFSTRNVNSDSDKLITESSVNILPVTTTIAYNAALSFDLKIAYVQESALVTANTVVSITNKNLGGTYKVYLPIDDTGGYSLTFDASFGTARSGSTGISSALADAVYVATINVSPTGFTTYYVETFEV